MNKRDHPELFENYMKFCRIRADAIQDQTIDLRGVRWFYPTTLLPLGVLIKKSDFEMLPPKNTDVRNYLNLIIDPGPPLSGSNRTYQPMATLPLEIDRSNKCLKSLYSALVDGKNLGEANPIKYLFGELVDSIYEHSLFDNAVVMAQDYEKKEFAEICFYDDGISIGGSFRDSGLDFDDLESLAEAVNGLSTKNCERGFGLSSNVGMCTEGLNGEFLVPGAGGLYLEKGYQKGHKLSEGYGVDRTLIGMRIPHREEEVDIYEYTE